MQTPPESFSPSDIHPPAAAGERRPETEAPAATGPGTVTGGDSLAVAEVVESEPAAKEAEISPEPVAESSAVSEAVVPSLKEEVLAEIPEQEPESPDVIVKPPVAVGEAALVPETAPEEPVTVKEPVPEPVPQGEETTRPVPALAVAAVGAAAAVSTTVMPSTKTGTGDLMTAPAPAAVTVSLSAEAGRTPAAGGTEPGWRLTSMDAFRGLVMLLMMGEVLEFSKVAEALPDSPFWQTLALHQTHVAWGGCVLHDLIQPSFSFLVGVALPFSLARRTLEGQPQWQRTLHAFWRALLLVLLGVFLRSTHSDQTYWTFEDTLSQIGLGYGFLYLLALKTPKVQAITGGALLLAYWLAFGLYPIVADSWPYSGFAAHWNLNANPAWAFDRWFLNLFPREAPFTANGGGYSTLSFIPTLATMILGLLAGGLLRTERGPWVKLGWLVLAGGVGLGAGWGLDVLGVCPVVKKIWTPSWVLYSGGAACLILAGFYLVMDVWKLRRWALFLTVVGMNSIAAYLIAHLFQGFIGDALTRHFGHRIFEMAGVAYAPLVHGLTVLIIEWLMLWWMFRRKLFLRI